MAYQPAAESGACNATQPLTDSAGSPIVCPSVRCRREVERTLHDRRGRIYFLTLAGARCYAPRHNLAFTCRHCGAYFTWNAYHKTGPKPAPVDTPPNSATLTLATGR